MPVELLYYAPGPDAPRSLGYARDSFEQAVEDLPKRHPVTHIGEIQFAFGADLAGVPGLIIREAPRHQASPSSVFGLVNLYRGDQRIHLEKPHAVRYRPALASLVYNLTHNPEPKLVDQIILFGTHYLPALELDRHRFPKDLANKRSDLLSIIADYLGTVRIEDISAGVRASSQYAIGLPGGEARRSGAQDIL